MNGHGDRAGTGTGTGVETRRRTKVENGHGSEHSSVDGNGDENNGNGNEDRIGEGRTEANKRKESQNSCRRHVGNGGDLGGKSKNCRKERVGRVTAKPDNLESNRAGRGAQGTQDSSKNCLSRESVPPLSRLIRRFRYEYH